MMFDFWIVFEMLFIEDLLLWCAECASVRNLTVRDFGERFGVLNSHEFTRFIQSNKVFIKKKVSVMVLHYVL
jgi:hypothetical protein